MSQIRERPGAAASSTPDPRGLPRLALFLAAIIAVILLSVRSGSGPAVAFVTALVLSVILHEAGHFVTAKWAGMKVTEFFVGFGPRLWSFRRGETEYGVKGIPAGGYVKIVGMSNLEKDIDPADEPRTYRHQSFPRRLLVVTAGILTHFVISFLLLMLVWTVVGVPNEDKPTLEVGSLSRLESGPSPAISAGFEIGDKVVAVDGRPVTDWRELRDYIQGRAGQSITFEVERDGGRRTLVVTPASVNPEGEPVGFVGIGAKPTVEKVNPVTALGRSTMQLGRLTYWSVKALGSFFAPSSLRDYADQLTGGPGREEENRPISLVGIARIADQAADRGLFDFLGMLILVNVFFAIFNLVPLLPLDGGHIAVAVYERLRTRKGEAPYRADVSKLLPVAAAVIAILAVMGITSFWLDIVDPVNLPGQ
jgi:membrane-associated protease RseP (regulator of RpoE activity)